MDQDLRFKSYPRLRDIVQPLDLEVVLMLSEAPQWSGSIGILLRGAAIRFFEFSVLCQPQPKFGYTRDAGAGSFGRAERQFIKFKLLVVH